MEPEPIREYLTMPFRDGERAVPDYLAHMMSGIPTHRMTYTDAIDAANRKAASDFLNAKQDDVLAAHFRRGLR